jgi:hypothetical protein
MAKNAVRSDDWNVAAITLAGADVIVTTAPARLGGVYINTVLSAHTIALKSGSNTLFTIPGVGRCRHVLRIVGATFPSSLVVSPNASGTGESLFCGTRSDGDVTSDLSTTLSSR